MIYYKRTQEAQKHRLIDSGIYVYEFIYFGIVIPHAVVLLESC